MKSNSPHSSIRSFVVEIDAISPNMVESLQPRVLYLLKNEIAQRIEKAIQNKEDGKNYRIPKIELDLGVVAYESLEKEFPQKLSNAFEQSLMNVKNGMLFGVEVVDEKKVIVDTLLFFLTNGFLPWSMDANRFLSIIESWRSPKDVQLDINQKKKLLICLNKRDAQERFKKLFVKQNFYLGHQLVLSELRFSKLKNIETALKNIAVSLLGDVPFDQNEVMELASVELFNYALIHEQKGHVFTTSNAIKYFLTLLKLSKPQLMRKMTHASERDVFRMHNYSTVEEKEVVKVVMQMSKAEEQLHESMTIQRSGVDRLQVKGGAKTLSHFSQKTDIDTSHQLEEISEIVSKVVALFIREYVFPLLNHLSESMPLQHQVSWLNKYEHQIRALENENLNQVVKQYKVISNAFYRDLGLANNEVTVSFLKEFLIDTSTSVSVKEFNETSAIKQIKKHVAEQIKNDEETQGSSDLLKYRVNEPITDALGGVRKELEFFKLYYTSGIDVFTKFFQNPAGELEVYFEKLLQELKAELIAFVEINGGTTENTLLFYKIKRDFSETLSQAFNALFDVSEETLQKPLAYRDAILQYVLMHGELPWSEEVKSGKASLVKMLQQVSQEAIEESISEILVASLRFDSIESFYRIMDLLPYELAMHVVQFIDENFHKLDPIIQSAFQQKQFSHWHNLMKRVILTQVKENGDWDIQSIYKLWEEDEKQQSSLENAQQASGEKKNVDPFVEPERVLDIDDNDDDQSFNNGEVGHKDGLNEVSENIEVEEHSTGVDDKEQKGSDKEFQQKSDGLEVLSVDVPSSDPVSNANNIESVIENESTLSEVKNEFTEQEGVSEHADAPLLELENKLKKRAELKSESHLDSDKRDADNASEKQWLQKRSEDSSFDVGEQGASVMNDVKTQKVPVKMSREEDLKFMNLLVGKTSVTPSSKAAHSTILRDITYSSASTEVLLSELRKWIEHINHPSVQKKAENRTWLEQIQDGVRRCIREERFKTVALILEMPKLKIKEWLDMIDKELQKHIRREVDAYRNHFMKLKEEIEQREKMERAASAEIVEGESIFVSNSGIVLLNPYIKRLFSRLELINKDVFVDDQSIEKAIAVLQYLINGDQPFKEFELCLPKIIVGLKPNEFVKTGYVLSQEEMTLCDGLLDALINHWSVLKSTSRDGLRENFFRRDGRLLLEAGAWRLKVEKKPYDILLAKIPWSYSMVHYPWMKFQLLTEWE